MLRTENNGEKRAMAFGNKRIAIISDMNLTFDEKHNEPLTAFAMMLCLSGEGSLFLNRRELTVRRNDLILCSLGTTVQGRHM